MSIDEESLCYICLESVNQLPTILPCKHKLCFYCLYQQISRDMLTCPCCRRKFSPENVKIPSLNKNSDDSGDSDENILWLYNGRNNGWWKYDDTNSHKLETEYCKTKGGAENIVKISAGINQFIVNLSSMIQINVVTKSERYVRRICKKPKRLLIKGMSGISYDIDSTSSLTKPKRERIHYF